MVNWQFWKRRAVPTRILRLRPRGEASGARLVDFAQLAPDVETYLGQAAYLQLGYFETLTRLIRATEDLAEKEALSLAAAAALRKHRGIVSIIADRGGDATTTMAPFQAQLDGFRGRTIGARPRETMLSVIITAGILDDFYLSLATSYGDTGRRVGRILKGDNDREAIAGLLQEMIAGDAEWQALLSMWARRLVGDALLVARAALLLDDGERPGGFETDAARAERAVEPVFTALMGAHSSRMSALGLAA